MSFITNFVIARNNSFSLYDSIFLKKIQCFFYSSYISHIYMSLLHLYFHLFYIFVFRQDHMFFMPDELSLFYFYIYNRIKFFSGVCHFSVIHLVFNDCVPRIVKEYGICDKIKAYLSVRAVTENAFNTFCRI